MELKINVSKLDKKRCLMPGIIGALAVLAAFYQFYYDPSHKEIKSIYREIEDRNSKINNALIHAAMTKKLEKEITLFEKQLKVIRTKIAANGEIIPVIKTIEDEAQRLNLTVMNMSTNVVEPSPPRSEEKEDSEADTEDVLLDQVPGYVKVSFDISLQGKYDKLENYIKVLQNMTTFLIIDELDIVSNEKLYPRLMSNLYINVYSKKGVGDIVVNK